MTNKIEDLKSELGVLDLTPQAYRIYSDCIDHLSQNDRWKSLVPDDMVVVPREPTWKMLDASYDFSYCPVGDKDLDIAAYKAMIAAQEE